jgi:acetolactate synthase I/III small subunit
VRHVAALLAKRAYPLLALTCLPGSDGSGRLMLTVADDGRLDRLAIELTGLPEVASARRRDTPAPGLADRPGATLPA